MRIKVAKALFVLVQQLGNNLLFFKEADKLVGLLGTHISDASQEVRHFAKQAFQQVHQAVISTKDLQKLFLRALTEAQYKKVTDFLQKEPSFNKQVNSEMAISQLQNAPKPTSN